MCQHSPYQCCVTSISPAEPSGKVSKLSVTLVGSGEHEANISWSPLAPGEWNGIPYGYYVSYSETHLDTVHFLS